MDGVTLLMYDNFIRHISVPALVLCPMSSTRPHFGLHAAQHAAHCYGWDGISCETVSGRGKCSLFVTLWFRVVWSLGR